MTRERRMNPKCHSRTGCDTFSARNADSTGLFLMPITRAASCVDGPRLARDLLTRRTEVACCHVSGLLMQPE
jgi:hypothetical protein